MATVIALETKPRTRAPAKTSEPNPHHRVYYDTYDSIYYLLYFIGRYLVVLTSYSLCVIAALYATGSLVVLEATNLFCPLYTLEEIREYNYENGYEHGSSDSCVRIDRQGLDLSVLQDLNSNVLNGKIDSDSIDAGSFLLSILYSLTAIILFVVTLYQTYWLLYDTVFAIRSCYYGIPQNYRVRNKLSVMHRKIIRKLSKTNSNNNKNNKHHDEEKEDSANSKSKSTKQALQQYLCCCFMFVSKSFVFLLQFVSTVSVMK